MFLRDNTTHTPVMEVNTAVPATQGSSAAGVIAVANRRATGPGRNPVNVPAPAMGSALSIRAKDMTPPAAGYPGHGLFWFEDQARISRSLDWFVH